MSGSANVDTQGRQPQAVITKTHADHGGGILPQEAVSPMRRCAVCRVAAPKGTLHRLVRAGGAVAYDPSGRAPGRGAYVCSAECCGQVLRQPLGMARALRAQEASEIRAAVEGLAGVLGLDIARETMATRKNLRGRLRPLSGPSGSRRQASASPGHPGGVHARAARSVPPRLAGCGRGLHMTVSEDVMTG